MVCVGGGGRMLLSWLSLVWFAWCVEYSWLALGTTMGETLHM